jgi:hypothetical protein
MSKDLIKEGLIKGNCSGDECVYGVFSLSFVTNDSFILREILCVDRS